MKKKSEIVNVLMDNCSQQTVVSENIVKKLGLTPIRSVNRNFMAFGRVKEWI